MSKTIATYVLLAVVVIAALVIFKYFFSNIKIAGNIQEVNESTIVVNGRYDNKDKKALTNITLQIPKDVKIIKTSFIKPSSSSKEPFYVDKLPKQTSEVGINTLIEDRKNVGMGVEIILKRSFLDGSLVVREIRYVAPQYK